MRIRLAGAVVATCCLLGRAGSASAHHGFNVEPDGTSAHGSAGHAHGRHLGRTRHAYLQMDVEMPGCDGRAAGAWR